MKTEIEFMNSITDPTSMHLIIKAWVDKKLLTDSIAEAVDLAKHEIAKKIWQENSTEIMAKMNLDGLAKLIAIYAAHDLAPGKR